MMTGPTLCCAFAVLATVPQESKQEEPKVHRYTDADLERVRPRRGRTGIDSQPAHRRSTRPDRKETRSRRRDEEYWRRTADALRERLERFENRIAELRQRVEDRRRRPGVAPYSDPRIRKLEERIRIEERRRDERWRRFLERARRAGVPRGWLR